MLGTSADLGAGRRPRTSPTGPLSTPSPTVRTLGVLGGMGPLATARFYERVVRETPARADQEHIPTIIWSDGRVPDRTAALQGRGPSPLPKMAEGARFLDDAGAQVIAIPCNTAHAFLTELQAVTEVPIIDMVDVTLDEVTASSVEPTTIGILSTSGTRMARLYDTVAARRGLRVVYVSWGEQAELVEPAIHCVKDGSDLEEARRLTARAALSLHRQGADSVVLACTELPLVAEHAAELVSVIDSLSALARSAVRMCLPTTHVVSWSSSA